MTSERSVVDGAPSRGASAALIAVVVVVAVQALFLAASGRLGPATGAGNLAAVGGTLASLLLALWFQRRLGLGLGEIGLRRPASWPRTILLGVVVAMVSGGLAQGLMTYLVQPLIEIGTPDVSRFEEVRGSLGTLLVTVPTVWLTSAFPEEVIWRGFLMTRLAKLAGGSKAAWAMALLATSAHFGLVHFYQGPSGMILTGTVGLLYALAFLAFGRNLWLVIVAHAVTHLLSFTAMYLGAA